MTRVSRQLPPRTSWSAALLLSITAFAINADDPDRWLAGSTCRAPIDESAAQALFEELDDILNAPPAFRDEDGGGSCIVLLSLGGENISPIMTAGRGRNPEAAMRHAFSLQPPDARQGARWRRLDLIDEVMEIASTPPKHTEGLWGLATGESSTIVLPGDIMSGYRMLDNEGNPGRIATYKYLRDLYYIRQPAPFQGKRHDEVELPQWTQWFSSQAWFSDGNGRALLLYRGHRADISVTREVLREAARQGGEYLLRVQKPDGSFSYLFAPSKNRELGGYNMLRHAGTAYSLSELYRVTSNEAYRESAEKALDYLRDQTQPCPAQNDAVCVVEGGEIKLGGNGLAILAITEYVRATGDETLLPIARKLALWIVSALREDGAFRPQQWTYPEGAPIDRISRFYPGEAILGLLRLHRLDARGAWIDSARSAARYLIEVRDAGKQAQNLAPDHWLLYALADLYAFDPNPLYLEHGNRLRLATRNSQLGRDVEFPDWSGGYLEPPSVTTTATRTEGLIGAWRLAREAGQGELLTGIMRTACLGARFLLINQFRPESAMFLPDPTRVLGGFRGSLSNSDIRIDYVQHNVSALLGVMEMIDQSPSAVERCEGI